MEKNVKVLLKNWEYVIIDHNSDWTFKKRLRFSPSEVKEVLSILSYEQLESLKSGLTPMSNSENQVEDDDEVENIGNYNFSKNSIDNNKCNTSVSEWDNYEYESEEVEIWYSFKILSLFKNKNTRLVVFVIAILVVFVWVWIVMFSTKPIRAWEILGLNNDEIYSKMLDIKQKKLDKQYSCDKDILNLDIMINKYESQINYNNTKSLIDSKGDQIIQKIESNKNK